MKQCDSPYIVKYFGSYFKDADLWVEEINSNQMNFFLILYFQRLLWNIVELVQCQI